MTARRKTSSGFAWPFCFIITITVLVFSGMLQLAFAQKTAISDPCGRETFFHTPVNKDEIKQNFTDSILLISAGDRTGTGYVIDSERGYVLTAFHVVEEVYGKDPAPIQATNPTLGNAVLHLKIIRRLGAPQDTALLQATNADLLKKYRIPALDIALNFPTGEFVTLGYPLGKKNADVQTAELLDPDYTDTDHGSGEFLEIKQSVDEGSSGSPLIDDSGAVIATLVDKVNIGLALYTPLVDVQDLLNDIPVDEQASALDKEVFQSRSPGSEIPHLIQELKWKPNNPSNVELFEWANIIRAHLRNATNADIFKPYLSCPIIQAYSERRLTESPAIRDIAEAGPQEAQLMVSIDSVNQNLLRQKFDIARLDANKLYAAYDGGGQNPAQVLTLLGRADLYTQRYGEATKYLTAASTHTQNNLDKAEIQVNTAQAYVKLGSFDQASELAQDAIPQFRVSGNRHGEALAYETLAQTAIARGDYTNALERLRQARKLSEARSPETSVVDTELRQVAAYQTERRRSDVFDLTLGSAGLAGLLISYLAFMFIRRWNTLSAIEWVYISIFVWAVVAGAAIFYYFLGPREDRIFKVLGLVGASSVCVIEIARFVLRRQFANKHESSEGS